MKKLIIFGVGQFAELADYYFTHDSDYEVEVFCLDKEYLENDQFREKPVVAYDTISEVYPPTEYDIFIAIGYNDMNISREQKYLAAKRDGYNPASYLSSDSIVRADQVGEHTFIFEQNNIQPFSTIGNNVIMWSGNHIGHHAIVNDHTFISSHVVIAGNASIGAYSFLGVNSTIAHGISLGKYNLITAGAVVGENTEDYAVYSGNPGRKRKVSSLRIKI